jgi:hypothetical protein
MTYRNKSESYPWQRFWMRGDEQPTLDENGFLPDPLTTMGRAVNPQVADLDVAGAKPCLILLGEAGIGKTHTLKRAYEDLRLALAPGNADAHFVELGEIQSESELERRIFRSDAFTRWRAGGHELHLFLDGLDECRLQLRTADAALRSHLEDPEVRKNIGRLRLRLGCRASAWPEGFTERLRDLWGPTNVDFRNLAPLRWKDVDAAAELRGLRPAEFLAEMPPRGSWRATAPACTALAAGGDALSATLSTRRLGGTLTQMSGMRWQPE